jgi:hypothetical protein
MKTGEELGKTEAARSPKVRGWLVPSLQLRIRIQHFRSLLIQKRIRIQGFDAALWNRKHFLRFRFRLLKSYGSGFGSGSSYRTEETFSIQKGTSRNTKHEIS